MDREVSVVAAVTGRHRTPGDAPAGPVAEIGDTWDAAPPARPGTRSSRGRLRLTLVAALAGAGVVAAIAVSVPLLRTAPVTAEPPLPPTWTGTLEPPSLAPPTDPSGPTRTRPARSPAAGAPAGLTRAAPAGSTSAPPTNAAAATEPSASVTATATGSPSATPQWTTLTVHATAVWNRGDTVQTNRTRLTLRGDGDLVILDEDGTQRWHSNTTGSGDRAVFQDDGNLVVYDRQEHPLWTSGSAGQPGAVLVLSADGDVDIVVNGAVIWSSNTAH